MLTDEIANWFLVFARVGALLAILPVFSMQHFPVRMRVALSLFLAVLLAPFLPPVQLDQLSFGSLIGWMAIEISVGLLLGFICRLIFFALDLAGGLISTEMGLMMSAEFNQLTGASTSAPGMILYWLAVMLWFSLDLHHYMIAAVQRSYALIPAGGAHLSEMLLVAVVKRTGAVFVIAVQIAAPMLAVSFIIVLVFSMLGRAVPQMNVFAESFPVRTLAGLVIFGLTCLFMAQHILNYLRRLPEDALRVAQLLGAG